VARTSRCTDGSPRRRFASLEGMEGSREGGVFLAVRLRLVLWLVSFSLCLVVCSWICLGLV
jgi:hypothetical protein